MARSPSWSASSRTPTRSGDVRLGFDARIELISVQLPHRAVAELPRVRLVPGRVRPRPVVRRLGRRASCAGSTSGRSSTLADSPRSGWRRPRRARRHGAALPRRRPQHARRLQPALPHRRPRRRRGGGPAVPRAVAHRRAGREQRLRRLRPVPAGGPATPGGASGSGPSSTLEPVRDRRARLPSSPRRRWSRRWCPIFGSGRYDDAARAHVRAYRRHRHERDAFPYLAEHLRFCALTGNADRGLDILAEHLGWLDRPFDDSSAMEFSRGRRAGVPARRRPDPRGPSPRPIGAGRPPSSRSAQLGDDLAAQARDLAARFDARNGTDQPVPADRGLAGGRAAGRGGRAAARPA